MIVGGNTENETVAYLQFSISYKKELNEIDKEWKITHVSRSREPTNYFFSNRNNEAASFHTKLKSSRCNTLKKKKRLVNSYLLR